MKRKLLWALAVAIGISAIAMMGVVFGIQDSLIIFGASLVIVLLVSIGSLLILNVIS